MALHHGINLDSAFLLVKPPSRLMKHTRRGGHIVMVSSTARSAAKPSTVTTRPPRAAIISMVKGLSTELARDRIYVNCVAPDGSHRYVRAVMAEPEMQQKITSLIPLAASAARKRSPDQSFFCVRRSQALSPVRCLTSTAARSWWASAIAMARGKSNNEEMVPLLPTTLLRDVVASALLLSSVAASAQGAPASNWR